jgi:hypothetical protein
VDKRLIPCGIIFASLALAGCPSSKTLPTYTVVDSYCDIARPILPLKAEIILLSRETKQQIYAHNETWKKKCNGDKMPSRKD